MSTPNILIPEGRLQRACQDSKSYISKFRQVLARHGVTMTLISIGCVLFPSVLSGLFLSVDNFFLNINKYLIASLSILISIVIYLKFFNIELNYRQIFWVGYLLLISIVEEIGFRLSLPILFSEHFLKEYHFVIGILFSNLIFASLHYFTLRWKFKACIFAFLGGIGLSRIFYITEDLALIILIHWAITFLNTPTAPEIIKKKGK